MINYLQAKAEMSVSVYSVVNCDNILDISFTFPNKNLSDQEKEIFKTNNDVIHLKKKE